MLAVRWLRVVLPERLGCTWGRIRRADGSVLAEHPVFDILLVVSSGLNRDGRGW